MYYTQESHARLKLKIKMHSRKMFKCVNTFDSRCTASGVVPIIVSYTFDQTNIFCTESLFFFQHQHEFRYTKLT